MGINMTKELTEQQIREVAEANGIEYAVIRAIIDVECNGSGFLPDGTPTILFERHKYWLQLGKINFYSIRREMRRMRPDLCHKHVSGQGGYGYQSEQPERMDTAIKLINDILPDIDNETFEAVRVCGLKSASWGLGQILASNYEKAGFDSVQDFINGMYASEKSQLEIMVTLLINWGLLEAMKQHDWRAIARKWNGRAYARQGYHTKLANSYLNYA